MDFDQISRVCTIRAKKLSTFFFFRRFTSVSFTDETESSFKSSLSETSSFDTGESVEVSSTFSLEFLGVALEFFGGHDNYRIRIFEIKVY